MLTPPNNHNNFSSPNPPAYSAADYAGRLLISRQAVAALLRNIKPDGYDVRGGQQTPLWALSTLPTELCAKLEQRAHEQDFRDAAYMMANPSEPWNPPVEPARIPQRYWDKARKECDIWKPIIDKHNDASYTMADRIADAEEGYKKHFGYAPRDRRTLIDRYDRIRNRARGSMDFSRLELYLPDRIKPTAEPDREFDHSELRDTIRQFENCDDPTANDTAFFYHDCFAYHQRRAAEMTERRDLRRFKLSLLKWMLAALKDKLAPNLAALRRKFDRKFIFWRDNEQCVDVIMDRRPVAARNRSDLDIAGDIKKWVDLAVQYDGEVTLAWRELWKQDSWSVVFKQRYGAYNMRRAKSRVPNRLRGIVSKQVEAMLPLNRGKRTYKLAGPYIMRNYDDMKPGARFVLDDWTPPLYHYPDDGRHNPILDADRKVQFARGQILSALDIRSLRYVGDGRLHGAYNSGHIVKTLAHLEKNVGLPHDGFQMENGVWRSRLVKNFGQGYLPFRDITRFLESPGIECKVERTDPYIRRTYLPRGKVIEGIFQIIQRHMHWLPGYCGRNEQSDKWEPVQKAMRDCRAGKFHPRDKFLSETQWYCELDKIIAEYNAEPQNGRLLKGNLAEGMSPDEKWAERQPLRKLAPEESWIFSTKQDVVTVRSKGVTISPHGQPINYCGKESGPWINHQVIAYYNVNYPELLVCSDLKKQKFFTVKTTKSDDPFYAPKEQIRAINTDRNAHADHYAIRFGQIERKQVNWESVDATLPKEDLIAGGYIAAAVERDKSVKSAETRQRNRIHREADRLEQEGWAELESRANPPVNGGQTP